MWALTLRHTAIMRQRHGRVLVVQFILWIALLKVAFATACLPLSGIVPGGGEGTLDFDIVSVSLEQEPFFLTNPLVGTIAGCSSGLETPITMRNLLALDTALFSVTSMFNPGEVALDIFGDKQTSDDRRRCQPEEGEDSTLFDLHLRVAAIYILVYGGLKGMPYCLELVEPLMEAAGHPLSFVLDGDPAIDTPWGLAKAYVDETNAYLDEHDGWNADGSMSREFNRIPFSDYAVSDSAGNSWSPYVPKNTPHKFKKKKSWQPLMETDDLGYISTQEHVTPHIGVTARFFGFRSPEDEASFAARELKQPRYKYGAVAHDAIEESRLMATDAFKQAAIEFFDNKFKSLVPLKIRFFMQAMSGPTSDLTALDFYRLTVEIQLAMYNSVVLAWREKIRHDLPRPPSVIRHQLGDTLVEAYTGPEQGLGTMKASEWEPFIRTMPHSEFPSASSCLCQAYAEQMANFLENGDVIDPRLEYDAGVNDVTFEFGAWSEISAVCGDSRVWGGMHFADAVPAGADLCGGNLLSKSISASIGALIDGDETAVVFDRNVGELMLRPL